jgi:hypothetical protein
MSYIGHDNTARTFAPGWFLAKEECERKTREISESGATTTADGTKYVPMGTIYPANDATAEGIVYEDIDVTNGNKAGSVVLSGVVYEDRLAEAVDTYSPATVPSGGNPKTLGLYERSGSSPNYVYTLTTDTTAADGKTYYSYDGKKIASAAKTALEGKGFTFVATAPEVVRPD